MTQMVSPSPIVATARKEALLLFVAINLSALAITTIAAHHASKFGLLNDSGQTFLLLVLTACVAVPVAGLAAQHKIDVEALKAKFFELDPIDPLTGLLDRRFFERVLRDEMSRMSRTGRPSALALFEVDDLSSLKENYGRAFRNATLKQVSVHAHAQLRGPFDKVSRWTDDRFIVLMHDVSVAQAEHVCERLRAEVSRKPITHKGYASDITLSFGVSSFPPHSDVESVLDRAESGLSLARKYGGDRVLNDTPFVVPTAPATHKRRHRGEQ